MRREGGGGLKNKETEEKKQSSSERPDDAGHSACVTGLKVSEVGDAWIKGRGPLQTSKMLPFLVRTVQCGGVFLGRPDTFLYFVCIA